MKKSLLKSLVVLVSVSAWGLFGSWTGGPAPDCKNDSLAVVRVIKPINELFDIKPVVVVSKGSCKIEQVEVSDAEAGSGDLLAKQTLTNFLTNGYTIQSATESVDSGMRLNTYYLKKKVI
ncbi:MAG: hypothetical protein ACPGU4_01615 [Flavobacteriales bacterium]